MQKKFKLLVGGMSVCAVASAVAMTGGTSAFYYDVETQTGNKVQACGFDLEQDVTWVGRTPWTGNHKADSFSQAQATIDDGAISITGVEPGDAFFAKIRLQNTGDCVGVLQWDVNHHADLENGQSEAEINEGGDTTAGAEQGELGGYMDLAVVNADASDTFYVDKLATIGAHLPAVVDWDFEGGETRWIFLSLYAPVSNSDRAVENKIMSDSYEFSLDFSLGQKGHVPDVASNGSWDLSIIP